MRGQRTRFRDDDDDDVRGGGNDCCDCCGGVTDRCHLNKSPLMVLQVRQLREECDALPPVHDPAHRLPAAAAAALPVIFLAFIQGAPSGLRPFCSL